MFLRARLLYYICNLFWAASVLSNQIILHGSNAGDRTLEEGLGTVIKLSDRYYYLPKRVSASYYLINGEGSESYQESPYTPLTVIASQNSSFSLPSIETTISTFLKSDDVFTDAFAGTILYNADTNLCQIWNNLVLPTSRRKVYLATTKPSNSEPSGCLILSNLLSSGPYFAKITGNHVTLHEAWRLYSDTYEAFFYGVFPASEDSYATLHYSLPDSHGSATVAVPSRLYFTPSLEKPLAGVRVGVKDIYDLKGLKTSQGSRQWLNLYPPAEHTADAVKHLIDLGAIIVGKTRCSQLANGQYGSSDNIDYHTSRNPRGDGYQDPSSSSSGSGVAGAAYGWLDLNLGSDTGGSIRAPAGVNGVFGMRPSYNAISLKGALPVSNAFDTAGLITSDAHKLSTYGKAFYEPLTFLGFDTPGFFPVSNRQTAHIYEQFVQSLERFLKTKRKKIDLYKAHHRKFGAYPPDWIGPAWSLLTAYDQWHSVGKDFFQDYQKEHDGDSPFTDPPITTNWAYARGLSPANRTFYLERKQRFAEWISSEILVKGNRKSCSDSLMVFPLHQGIPSYKHLYHDMSPIFNGWNRYSISQLAQAPEIVVPIGQTNFTSIVTGTTKYLPISISILAAAGCDFVLLDLLEALVDAGIISSSVLTGNPLTFPL